MKEEKKEVKFEKNKTKRNSSYRGKSRQGNGDCKVTKSNRDIGFKSGNDFSWYWQNPQVATDASRINYSNVVGHKVPLSAHAYRPSDTTVATVNSEVVVPGILTLEYVPTIGYAADSTANVNVAARLIYTYVRHVNSGSKVYESPDLMTYLLAVANAQAYYAYLVRIYGLLNTTSIMNRYVPDALITECGGDANNLRANMAQFRYYINQFAVKLNTFAVPKDFYYYDRITFLPLHVFKDGEDSKSQFYVFKPKFFYKWDGTGENGSRLLPEEISTSWELDELQAFGDNLINAMMTNEDIGIMSGDILKAFGEEGIRKISLMPDDYVTIPVKDEGVLWQIHNASVFFSQASDLTPWNIDQDQGELLHKPVLDAYQFSDSGRNFTLLNQFIDAPMASPSPEFTMESTRLVAFGETVRESDNTFKCHLKYFGTEIITGLSIRRMDSYASLSGASSDSSHYGSITKFDWHPLLYVAQNGGQLVTMPIGDLQNYTTIDGATMNRIHNAALQSLFNVYKLYIKTI